MNWTRHGTAVFVLATALGLAPACGSSGSEDASSTLTGGTSSGGSGGSNTGGTGADIGTGGGTSANCSDDDDCGAEQVCHPVALECVTVGDACTDHGDCDNGSYCDASLESCLPGLTGSPCSSNDNCSGTAECSDQGLCGCSGFSQEQEEEAGPLDIFFIFDRTGSMGSDCDYVPGEEPPENSKACYATYAMADYLINVQPVSDTRLAFDFMSYGQGCNGAVYDDPLVGLTQLPVTEDHALITEISDEDFSGGSGTRIEDALNGIARFTAANRTPGREMIGVLMTDGDPSNHCDNDIPDLAQIIADHLADTGIRTFIIGMDGATEESLEELAVAGGAEPHDDFCGNLDAPCHYWNVGEGSGDVLESALQAIVQQATPLPCEYALADVMPEGGQSLDLSTLNVRLTQNDMAEIIVNVANEGSCPSDQYAWYYDDADDPTEVVLCQNACDLVTNAEAGARVDIVGGCSATVILR